MKFSSSRPRRDFVWRTSLFKNSVLPFFSFFFNFADPNCQWLVFDSIIAYLRFCKITTRFQRWFTIHNRRCTCICVRLSANKRVGEQPTQLDRFMKSSLEDQKNCFWSHRAAFGSDEASYCITWPTAKGRNTEEEQFMMPLMGYEAKSAPLTNTKRSSE